ncbi:MAG: T9SS type A sorting domain-containing protein [Ignavibacteria bacterium]|jgi:photosystem II stability/assembly factor-like uncharacterized protein
MKKFTKIFIIIFFSVLIFFGFAIPLNLLSSNWYNQYLPNLNNRPLSDITFVDSLLGFAVIGNNTSADTNYIIKTTNGGDNWFKLDSTYGGISRIIFLNANTGFVGGGSIHGGFIYKTTNSGINWFLLPASVFASHFDDMYLLNQDTIFVVDDDGFYGGVYRTTNGGNDWEHLIGSPAYLPQKIYMYDRNLGFFSTGSQLELFRTTNSGINWIKINGEVGFSQITFIDALTGWKASGYLMKKSTNGGLNWINQPLPVATTGYISGGMFHFSIINKDTIWGVGGSYQYPNLQNRGVIYRTTNGGNNWLFQIPDTSIIKIPGYSFIYFYNKFIGWAYIGNRGIHTTNGGDTTFISNIKEQITNISKDFVLFQNYPNPFNQCTIINVQCTIKSYLEIKVFDISGREITTLINEKKSPGIYEVRFKGDNLSSGVYFYSLFMDGVRVDTKKMVLIK